MVYLCSITLKQRDMKATETTQVFDRVTRQYRKVRVVDAHYVTENGEHLYRVETKGRTGTTLYALYGYIDQFGYERPVYGMSGATGHGWGGRIIGYVTREEGEAKNIRF